MRGQYRAQLAENSEEPYHGRADAAERKDGDTGR